MKIPEGTQIRSQRKKMFIVDLMFKLMAWLSLNVFFPQAFITPDYLGIQVLTGGRMYMSNKRKKIKKICEIDLDYSEARVKKKNNKLGCQVL